MRCQQCGKETEVIDSRPSPTSIRRRRRCLSCDYRFTTRESSSPDDDRDADLARAVSAYVFEHGAKMTRSRIDTLLKELAARIAWEARSEPRRS